MFEEDLTELSTADLLESAAEHCAVANRADARLVEHAQVYADRHHPDGQAARPGRRSCDGRERAVVLGGEGCPQILEFAVAEFGVMLGISPMTAAAYIGQALALRHRFPFTWARIQAGEATPWKAGRIATDCSKLSEAAARIVDRRVAPIIDTITPYRLEKIVKAAKIQADPDLARAEAGEKARERGVFLGRSDEHGTKVIYIKAASGDAIRHDATIAGIAEALKTFGDTRPTQHRRAAAVGIIADPAYTQELLTQARNHHHNNPNPAAGTEVSTTPPAPTTDALPATAAAPTIGPLPATAAAPTAGALPAVPTAPTIGLFAAVPAAPTTGPLSAVPAAPTIGLFAAVPAAPTTGPFAGEDVVPMGRDAAHPDPGPAQRRIHSDADDPRTEWTDWPGDYDEPSPFDEADRDAPHPSQGDHPDPLDTPYTEQIEPFDPGLHLNTDDGEPLDAAAQRALHARLAQIKHDADTRHTRRTDHPTDPTTDSTSSRADTRARLRPGKTEIYVHLTDHTLATGTGVLRAEGIGPLIADQLTELIGHSPYTVKPVIDLNNAISVDAYEIPDRVRERVKLAHPVEVFPYGTRETHRGMDLDHIQPYDPLGPPGQTNTNNLAPLGRFTHRVKTHAHGWTVRRIDNKTLEWTTPHGLTFHVDPTGTHRGPRSSGAPDLT